MISSWRNALPKSWLAGAAVGTVAVLAALLAPAQQAYAAGASVANYTGLTPAQRANLESIARDTWKFYDLDVDSATNLPMDNITFAGGSETPTSEGRYTSAANIGVYLWAVVSARDLGLINEAQARARVEATLTEVSHLQRYDGFLYQWYDTTNGDVLSNPGQADCTPGPRRRITTASSCPTSITAGTPRGSSSCGRPCRSWRTSRTA